MSPAATSGRRSIDVLHDAGFETWALTPDRAATSIWEADVPDRLAVVLGAEGPGLAAATLQRASRRVRIPISSDVDSLECRPRRGDRLRRHGAGVNRPVETMGLEPTTPTLQR